MESCFAVQWSQGGQSQHPDRPDALRVTWQLVAGRRQKVAADHETSAETVQNVYGGRNRNGEVGTRKWALGRRSSRRPDPNDPSAHGVPGRAAVCRHRHRSPDHLLGRHSHEKQK